MSGKVAASNEIMGSQKKFYGKKYLNEECNSKKFLQSISYSVELRGNKKDLKLNTQSFQEIISSNFGKKKEEKSMRKYQNVLLKGLTVSIDDIASWNIFHDYLVFKTDPKEDAKQWIYIVCFNQDFKEIKVKNFVTDPSYIHLGVNQQLLYYGNKDFIKVVDIKRDIPQDKQFLELEPQGDDILTYEIKSPCKLHGFFENGFSKNDQYILCLVETQDNQIDFARLYFWSRDVRNSDIEFYQYREVVQRDLRNDPIQKITQVIIANEFQFGIVLRASGRADLYWNYTLTASTEEIFEDCNSNYISLFLKQRGAPGQIKIQKIDIKWDSRIGLDVAEELKFTDDYWDKIKDFQIRYFVQIYSALSLVNTTFLVSYNNIVSTFDIIRKQWLDHYIQDEEIVDLLRNQGGDNSDEYLIGILLKSGKIIALESTYEKSENVWRINPDKSLSIGNGFVKLVSDWRDISSHYILLKGNNGLTMVGYQNQTIRNLDSDIQIKENDQLVRFISKDPTQDFALYNENDGSFRVFMNSTGHQSECYVQQVLSYKISNYYDIEKKLHTIIQPNDQDHIFLFDTVNLYILNIKNEKITVLKDYNITNLQFIDNEYIYSLTNDCVTKKLTSGFYAYSISNLLEKEEDSLNFKLKSAIVGRNKLFEYYKQDERFAYMSDYNEIKIVPILHRNNINFIGMNQRKNYVGFFRQKDKLIALDKHNSLTTWDVTTGKIVGQYKLPSPVVSDEYKIYKTDSQDIAYQTDWYMPFLLLINTSIEVQGIDEKEYFGDRLHTSLPNNTAYSAIEQKTFRNFKIIEIINETQVRDHFTFVHPHYGYGTYQRIYFSNDLQYMLERLQNQRVFLYKRENTGTPGVVKWNLIRRLRQFPLDISESTYANYLFSPDLMYYLDFDKSDNVFLIKKSLDQTIKCQIPKGLMNPQSEEPKLISKRFKWVDSRVIKIINNEGIEKKIDIENGFKDLNQVTVPMINLKEIIETEKFHYYYQPKPLELGDNLARLIKKYQKYYAVSALDNFTDKDSLYETIFEVDFGVDDHKGKLVVDMSFTYIDWKLGEILATNPKMKIKRFTLDDIKTVLLCIFPKGNTFMHYNYKNLNNIRNIYDMLKADNEKNIDNKNFIPFEIPFLLNFKGKSPLHLCMEDNNFKAADVFLQYLASTPLDSHSRAIVDIVPKFVENGLPSFAQYLDDRMMQTKQLIVRGNQRGSIKYGDDLDYAVASCELWPDIEYVNRLLFNHDPRESEIKLEFLDMPQIHSYMDKIGDEFFKGLADSNDITIFAHRSIQALIDYKWPLAREYTVKILFIPFLLYHVSFIIYSNVFNGQYAFEDSKKGSMWIGHNVMAAVNYAFSIYFLSNEVRQVIVTGIDYFSSIWNYSDILPPMLIIVTVSLKLNILYNEKYEPSNFLYTVNSVASLLMWIKLLYFLRIFKTTSYLVRTLTDVLYDMKVFLFILSIVYFGFGEAFLRLSEKSDDEAQFIQNYPFAWVYSFRLSIGDNATDTFNDTVQPTTLWILWVIAGILTNVVMLNLLISIISDSFGRINEKIKEANYQERARIISENSYLIPKYIKKKLDDDDRYLIVANEVIDTQDDEKAAISNQVKNIEDQVNTLKEEVSKKQAALEEKLNSLLQ